MRSRSESRDTVSYVNKVSSILANIIEYVLVQSQDVLNVYQCVQMISFLQGRFCLKHAPLRKFDNFLFIPPSHAHLR